jgi:acylphosphatase
MISRHVIFEGRVQGVGFRYATKQLARGFDVTGWVRNLPDGTVELQLQGEREEVDGFLHELSEESALAHHIKNMCVELSEPLAELSGFTIR